MSKSYLMQQHIECLQAGWKQASRPAMFPFLVHSALIIHSSAAVFGLQYVAHVLAVLDLKYFAT